MADPVGMWIVQFIRNLCRWVAGALSVPWLLLILGVCGAMWWLEHRPLSHDCMFHGASAHIIKDDSGFRMVAESHTPGRGAADLRERSLADVMMEPLFQDGSGLEPVRTLTYGMGINRHPGTE